MLLFAKAVVTKQVGLLGNRRVPVYFDAQFVSFLEKHSWQFLARIT